MTYEGDDDMIDDFADQLLVVEDLVANNCDCHEIVGGDFNVDFSRDRLNTELLNSFCVIISGCIIVIINAGTLHAYFLPSSCM
jgi:hypothetical protein